MTNDKKAVLLLGHGSKAHEANETLRKVAASVQAAGGYGYVMPAFLQMERPDFQEAVETMTARGFTDIVVMPYFLYPGLHVTQDLPGEMDAAVAKHPGLKLTLVRHLGFDARLIDITVDRINGTDTHPPLGPPLSKRGGQIPPSPPFSKGGVQILPDPRRLAQVPRKGGDSLPSRSGTYAQHPIEAESFRIIDTELDAAGIPAERLPLVKRVIHTTADFGYAGILSFSDNAITAGLAAMRAGCNIVADVKMVEAGITRDRLRPLNTKVFCFSGDDEVLALAGRQGITKTAAGIRRAAPYLEGGIAVIGNAPTALVELLRLVREGLARPALIIGVPVGFVGAVEAKDELMRSGCEYIATKGRKGGSTVAAAIANAIAIMALEPSTPVPPLLKEGA
ncbi:MAG: precorrin-8X methylmutase [Deltaproteobacteria bacterium]|nr:precorrin-8X methylmutase [Deltaproteobacteria bacterium]